MKNINSIILGLMALTLSAGLKGQSDILQKADHAIRQGQFQKALSQLNNYPDIEQDANGLEMRGLCLLRLNYLNSAESDFTRSRQLGNGKPELFWYMARCRHHLLSYGDAAFLYRQYVLAAGEEGRYTNRALIEIKNCLYAASRSPREDKTRSLVQNFGTCNSPADDICPVRSRVFGNRFYFSSNRQDGNFKIYAFRLDKNGAWDSLDTSSEKYNYGKNNFVQDIDGDGSSMIILEKNPVSGRHAFIFTRITEAEEQRITLDNVPFRNAADIQLVNDSTVVFSSADLDGYGGFDLYQSSYTSGGWTEAVNLGPGINSAFDERTGYMAPDYSKVYFSSNRPYGYGGFDLYEAELAQDNTPAINLGAELNSPGDELHARFYDDGHMGVFSSDRKSGKGGFDLYFLYRDIKERIPEKDSTPFAYVLAMADSVDYPANPLAVAKNEPFTTIARDSISKQEHLLYYEDSYDIVHGKNSLILDAAAEILKDKRLSLSLVAHTDKQEPGLPEYVQYNCLKRAVKASDYLIEKGVRPEQLRIESMGAGIPAVKYAHAGQSLDSLAAKNKRIELHYYNERLEVPWTDMAFNTIDVPEYALSPSNELFLGIRDGLYFSVHIARTERIFKNAILRMYEDLYIRKESPDAPIDYYVGLYTRLEDARELLSKLVAMPGLSPEIKVFYKGVKLEAQDMERLRKKYPELRELLD